MSELIKCGLISMIEFSGFAELVKLFITFVILSQILCGKVQKNPHIFLHMTVSKFLLGLL